MLGYANAGDEWFETTGKIRELEGYADTPIIVLTSFAMKLIVKNAWKYGAMILYKTN
ncbi:MAG: hypothetical protein H6611_04490 [Ignavibacteriales bacterium]|nr:hypothetical protein [Ignavibacteriales bacterium]